MLASGSTSPLPARQHPVPLPTPQTLRISPLQTNTVLSDCDEPLWVYLVWLPLACGFALLIIQLPSCIRTWHHRTAEWVPLQSLGDGNLCTNRKRNLISPAAILYMKQHGRQKVAFIKASTLSVQLYLGILQESWLFPDKKHLSRGCCGSAA